MAEQLALDIDRARRCPACGSPLRLRYGIDLACSTGCGRVYRAPAPPLTRLEAHP